MGVLDAAARDLIVHTSTTKLSTDLIALLTVLDSRHGPKPGCNTKPVVLVLDNGPIHASKATAAAIAAGPWLTIEWLPRYAPELNDIELKWRDLKRHHLARRTFVDVAHLDHAVHQTVDRLDAERRTSHPCDKSRIAA